MVKRLVFMYKILDENDNDVTPITAHNEVTTNLGVDNVTDSDCFGLTRSLVSILNRIGENVLIRHLFPRNPHKVPKELCSSDPGKFAYFVQEYWVGRNES
jgi:hypothetical protein